MAIFTFTMRELVETFGEDVVKSWFTDYNLTDYLTPEEIAIIQARNTWSKEKLATKIIKHYYMHESGQETPGLFEHYAKVAMAEIMEEKLPLIYSASIKYDPLINVNYSETYRGENTNQYDSRYNSNTQNTGVNTTINSDTPQGKITKNEILGGDYASSTAGNESTDTNNATGNNNASSNGNESYIKTIVGNSGVSATSQKMIEQYRDNIIMIDRDIIEDLGKLFHGMMMI